MNLKLPNILILCFFTLASYAQKPVGEFSQNERRNLLTVTNAISSLKGIETPSLNFNDSVNKNHIIIYDSLLQKYYDFSYLRDSVKDASNGFDQQIGMQKLILYNIDHFLDIIPSDSIYISPIRYTELSKDSKYYPQNSLAVYYIINNSPFLTTIILFSKEGKLFAVSPLIHFDSKHNEEDIKSFYNRHGYAKIQSKLWRP